MTIGIFEYDSDTGEKLGPLTLLGQLVGLNEDGSGIYVPLTITHLGADTLPKIPGPPVLTGTQPSRTSSAISWTPFVDSAETPTVTSWQVERASSVDDGSSWSSWSPITGSPFVAATLSAAQTGLSTGTPEVMWAYRVRGVNSVGNGAWSNERVLQWAAAPANQPTAVTNLNVGLMTTTSAATAWQETADPSVTKHGLFVGGVLRVDNLSAAGVAYTWSGLTPGTTYTNVDVRRWNGQWSPASNRITFTTPLVVAPPFTMLMGSSASDNDHGGTEDWDGWRVYTESKMLARANLTGANRPSFLAYSKDGSNLGGSSPVYTTVFNEVKADLDAFYYGGSGQTRNTQRWGIKLYWSNGNENSDKGVLGPSGRAPNSLSATAIAGWVTSQKALYDAVHYIDPVTGLRRYPDAFAGSNPTQEHERLGIVQEWLHPSARYHDFVMWSMYPPGRGVNAGTLSRNPRWDWPSLRESDRTNRRLGFLVRCFYRTFQAQAQARIDRADPAYALAIGCGEVGIASNPDDRSTRPYYAVHALAGNMWLLANQYGLAMPFNCWWDEKTAEDKPHNVLSDEPPTSDHLAQGTGAAAGNNATATNPSTRVAWQNWMSYDKRQPGSTQPAQWAGNPKTTWDNYGTPL